jgi:hypothetical protein
MNRFLQMITLLMLCCFHTSAFAALNEESL